MARTQLTVQLLAPLKTVDGLFRKPVSIGILTVVSVTNMIRSVAF